MTVSIMTFSMMKLIRPIGKGSIMSFSIMSCGIMSFSIMSFSTIAPDKVLFY
jgi:hypothetical protein